MINRQFIRGIRINWEKLDEFSYIRNIASIKNLHELEFCNSVTFFVGENGSGKSTLLEAIAVAYGFNPEGGTKNYSFSTYDSHSDLSEAMTIVKGCRRAEGGYFLRAESFYNVATKEEEYSKSGGGDFYVPQKFHKRSHGESFLQLANHYFRANGVYLLDEPEAALSPKKQLNLMAKMHEVVKEGAQFIIASHSPILLGFPDAEILTFDEGTIHPCQYEETEQYQITKAFLWNRENVLEALFEE